VAWNWALICMIYLAGYALANFLVTAELRQYLGPRFLISLFVPLTVAALVQDMVLYQASIAVTFILTVRNRTDIACRYILLVMLLPTAPLYIGVAGVWWMGTMNMTGVLAVAALVATYLVRGEKNGALHGKFMVSDYLVIALFLIMLVWGKRFEDRNDFVRGMILWGNIFLVYLPLRRGLSTREDLHRSMGIMSVAAIILAVAALYEMRFRWSLFDTINFLLDFHRDQASTANIRGGYMRATVTMTGPLILASVFSFAVLATVASRRYYRTSWGNFLAMVLILAGVIACQSRGNTLWAGVGLVALLVLLRKWATVGTVVAAGALAAALFVAMPGAGSNQKLFSSEGYTYNGTIYKDYRSVLLARGIEVGMRHPLTGQTLGKNLADLKDIEQGQKIVDLVNTYITIFLLSGFPGLFFILGCMFTILGQIILTKPSRQSPEANNIRAFLIVALVSICVQIGFVSLFDRIPFLWCYALVGTRVYLLTRRSEQQATEATTVRTRVSLVERDAPALVLSSTNASPATAG